MNLRRMGPGRGLYSSTERCQRAWGVGPGPRCQPSTRPGMNAVEKRTQYRAASGQNHRCLHGRCIGFAVTTWASLASALTSSGTEHTLKGSRALLDPHSGLLQKKMGSRPRPPTGLWQPGNKEEASPNIQYRLWTLQYQSHPFHRANAYHTLRKGIPGIFTKNSPHTKNIELTVYTSCSHTRTPPRP